MRSTDDIWKWLRIILLSTLISFSLILITFTLYVGTSHKIAYRKSTQKYYYGVYYNKKWELDYPEIKNKVDQLFGNLHYRISEYDFTDCVLGDSNIYTREVRIKSNLSKEQYAFTLAHELVHINYVTRSERFCEFQAFKLLYESNDNYLIYVANWYASSAINGNSLKEYDCSGWIEEYLIKEGKIKNND